MPAVLDPNSRIRTDLAVERCNHGRGIRDRVLDAMRRVPRERFVEAGLEEFA